MSALNRDILERMPRLQRYARSLTRNKADAEDLVHDCIERALTKHSQFRAGTNLNAWLMTIMRRIFFNSMRQNMRQEQILQQQGTLAASAADQSPWRPVSSWPSAPNRQGQSYFLARKTL